jgi:hypothetical protein
VTWAARFARFLYDFVVGDDWTIAAGVVSAIGVTALIAQVGLRGWWFPPLAVIGLLWWSVWRATRSIE